MIQAADRAPRPAGTRQVPRVGTVIPAHASTPGPALNTTVPLRGVTDPVRLPTRLAEVRRVGIAPEHTPDEVPGAIGLVVPSGERPLEPAVADALRPSPVPRTAASA